MGNDVYCRREEFLGGKVRVKKRGTETQTVARMGGGSCLDGNAYEDVIVLNLQANNKQLNGNDHKRTGNYEPNDRQDATPIFECGRRFFYVILCHPAIS